MPGLHWLGYHRADGSVGVRNDLLVLSIAGLTGPTARRVAAALPHAKCVTMPFGSGLLGADADIQVRSLIGFGANPNVGGVLLIGSDAPKLAEVTQSISATGKPVVAVCLDDCDHDALTLSDRAVRAGAQLKRDISRLRRQAAPLSALCLGLECGRSDPSSGMVANPLIGLVADALERAGARVIFGETMEWLGAEHLLAKRGATPEVAQALVAAVDRRERLAKSHGKDLLGNNPGQENCRQPASSKSANSLSCANRWPWVR